MERANSPISYLIMNLDFLDLGKHLDEDISNFIFKIGYKYSTVF